MVLPEQAPNFSRLLGHGFALQKKGLGKAIEEAPLVPLHHHDPFGPVFTRDIAIGDPFKVGVAQLEIAGAQHAAAHPLMQFGAGHLPHQRFSGGQLHARHGTWPEGPQTLPQDQRQQAKNHEDAEDQRAARQP